MSKYQFVTMNGVQEFSDVDEIPFKRTGMTDDLSIPRASGLPVHRAELDNQPEYENFIGPMYDGGKLRYESPEVYEILSRQEY